MGKFHQTMMGRKFFEVDFIHFVKSVSELTEETRRANALREYQLQLDTRLVKAQERANELKEHELKLKQAEINLLKNR